MAKKIRILLIERDMTMTDLAKKLETSKSNLSDKMKRDNFSESDLQDICKILNCSYDVTIKMNDIGKEGKAAGQGGSKETIDL